MQAGPIHEALSPLKWMIGKWRSVSADGFYPTIQPFSFCEEISFTSVGQPILNYSSLSWHPVKQSPMHLESGFLRIKPGTNDVSFMVAHNFGLTTLEEGMTYIINSSVAGNVLQMKSTNIGRMSFGKEPRVLEIIRCYKLVEEGKLEHTLQMATSNTPLCQHLRVVYEKC
ncbi:hypothetical protein NQ318_018767 [Aromia moschata]|uniref:THAP4-like heme-binding domain-containing protein n=1 Tax=Aromia moschata TaxID=1265417 RepID=A0AAV8ZGG1_9CUCU|nr:hypothetical protein NQ318_018767 [Aromia moschata]